MRHHPTEVTYDADANMAYVRVVPPEPGSSVKQVLLTDDDLPAEIVVDIDRDGRIRGFEIFDATSSLPMKLLDEFD
jgi:uncharacterized protein YuzE